MLCRDDATPLPTAPKFSCRKREEPQLERGKAFAPVIFSNFWGKITKMLKCRCSICLIAGWFYWNTPDIKSHHFPKNYAKHFLKFLPWHQKIKVFSSSTVELLNATQLQHATTFLHVFSSLSLIWWHIFFLLITQPSTFDFPPNTFRL